MGLGLYDVESPLDKAQKLGQGSMETFSKMQQQSSSTTKIKTDPAKKVSNVAGGALSGAAAGAAMGTVGGLPGVAVGAIIGGLAGLFS